MQGDCKHALRRHRLRIKHPSCRPQQTPNLHGPGGLQQCGTRGTVQWCFHTRFAQRRNAPTCMRHTYVTGSCASAGTKKLPGCAFDTGVSSATVTFPTPANTKFFAICGSTHVRIIRMVATVHTYKRFNSHQYDTANVWTRNRCRVCTTVYWFLIRTTLNVQKGLSRVHRIRICNHQMVLYAEWVGIWIVQAILGILHDNCNAAWHSIHVHAVCV